MKLLLCLTLFVCVTARTGPKPIKVQALDAIKADLTKPIKDFDEDAAGVGPLSLFRPTGFDGIKCKPIYKDCPCGYVKDSRGCDTEVCCLVGTGTDGNPMCTVPCRAPSLCKEDGSAFCQHPTQWDKDLCKCVHDCAGDCPCSPINPCYNANRKTQCIRPTLQVPISLGGGMRCSPEDTDCHCPAGHSWQNVMGIGGARCERQHPIMIGRPFMHGEAAATPTLASAEHYIEV